MVDGTALCVGAATPDLAYSLGPWLNQQSHTALGLAVWAVPIAVASAGLIRWRAAAGVFAHLPDFGPFRLRSYRVLGTRRPRILVTLTSATVGAGSHIFIDGFTHPVRWGAQWLGFDRVLGSVPIRGEVTVAGLFQWLGHSLGSVAFVIALVLIASQGRLEKWYGAEAVEHARAVVSSGRERATFWVLMFLAPALGLTLTLSRGLTSPFPTIVGLFVGTIGSGLLVGTRKL